ncbi:HAMP domain-containing sensor histidine kinase [Nakamurella sp. A5-74]|uniref:histidine kinase n=1 Tax=Nakamurella sp. A5-74 TaxID=3158264 RepID=A0AAU8DNP4_9ACTN
MQLNLRIRIMATASACLVVGYLYLSIALDVGLDLVRMMLQKAPSCGDTWVDGLNGCTVFNPTLAVIELVVTTAFTGWLLYVLPRWCLRPLDDLALRVGQFGPTNLGLRVGAIGNDPSRRLADSIDQLLERVGGAYQAQSRFTANASHELRSPLATQRTLIEVSMGRHLTVEQQELLSRQLLGTNARSEHLIEGLLTLAESDQGVVSVQPVDLAAVADEVLGRVAGTRGLRILRELEPTTVAGEPTLLERLIQNLVDNALKYNVDDGWVLVRVAWPGTVIVSNSGPLVPPDQVPRLFEPFQRLSATRLSHTAGVGLGLTIVRSIVAAHGGTVTAAALPEGGLAVRIVLPAVRGDRAVHPPIDRALGSSIARPPQIR